MKRISTLSQTWGVRALVALGILSVLAPISGAGNLLSGFLPVAKIFGPERTEVVAAAKKTNTDETHRIAPMKATKPPVVKKAVETARRDVVCSLIIDNVSIGECRNDVETGFQSKVLVAVFVSWVDPPAGQDIEITVDGVTKTIDPAEKGCANYVQFILDADGSTQVADAEFSGGFCTAPSVIFNLPGECAGSAPCAGATSIGGRVYSDFDSDGSLDASEFGLEGAQIDLYDNNENLLCTATTDLQGEWTCTGLTPGQAVRAEISNFPSGYTPSGTGIDNNGGVVQFATIGTDCTVDFGLLDAGNFCENNPYVITPCYVRGDPAGGGTSGLMDVLVAVPYNASGNTSVNSYLARNDEAGSMWGVAYQKETKKLFTSAFLKRHCGWGPAGLGGIYVTDVSAIPAPGVSTTGLISTYFNLDAYGINTGNEASLTRNLGPNVNQPTYDGQVFDLVGKWGLGDIDISEDGDSLFIVNLHNRSLVTVAIGNPAVTPVPASAVSELTIPDPGCSNNSDWHPFALKYNNGKLYVGGVCSAQTSQDVDDLQAIIYEYSPSAGTFTEILNIPLGYDKGFVLTGLAHCENWNPWTNTFSSLPAGGIELCYPQPILSDIEFDVYGNMMVAFNDRGGHQMGWYDYGTTPPSTQTWKGNSGGDVLRVVNNNGTWLIERNATSGYDDGCGAGNGQGPCGGEFYCQDAFLSAHQEAVHGGIAVHPSNNELLLNMMDATSAFSGGLAWYNNASGIKNRAYRVYFSDNNGNNGTNGKAAGLGDVEILCGEAPIEIGNYVWADTDRDGIMDPGEPGLFGVNVALYKGGALITTTTTNISGQYKFSGANVLPNMAYCVAFGTGGQFINGTLSIGGASYAMTLPNIGFGANSDNNDSDVNPGGNTLPVAIQGLPVVCLVTGNYGDNDNTFDAGFFPVIDYGDLPDDNTAGSYPTNATNGAGEGVGPSHQIIPTLKMGASVDFEDGGQPSALANGDDTNGSPDDENGVTLPMFVAGQSVNVPVVVMNMTGSVAKLTGFFDWNKNGNLLNAGEMFSVNVPNGTNGTINLPVVVPASATLNLDLGLRFRLSTNAVVSMLPTGAAPDGEVEDYLAQVMAFDFGDLPDNNTAGSYPTDVTNGAGEGIGASHKINGTLKLGASVDFENNGQPSALANGDDTNGTDDENGVASFPTLTAGQPATIVVNVMNMSGNAAVLYAYFDWNKDGDFSDANETTSVVIPDGTNGNVNVSLTVPVAATTNMNLGVRFRLSNDVLAAGTPNGLAPNGEVEDYVVEVECPIILLSTVVDNANCFGSTDGSINLTVTGGSGTYTYDWSNDGPETPDNDPQDLNNIGIGTYTVTVTDITGCTAVTSTTVNQPTVLVPTTAVTNLSCNGGADGAIDLSVSGGTLPYVYDWSNDGPESPDTDNQDLAGLSVGSYTVTITDINGCVTTTGATLSQPAAGLNLTASQMNVSCNAGANGSINLTVTGGTFPYSYDWSNDGEEDPDNDSQDISGLIAGLYSVTVTDANGCSDILNVTITQPAPVQLSTAIMDVPCTSGNNGGIVLTVTGGTPGYSYDWSNDGPESPDNDPKDLTNVPAGTYTVTVTDANLCTAQTSVTVDEPMLGLSLDIAVTNVNCSGVLNLTVGGGTPVYTYDWSNDGPENPDNDTQDLTVTVAGTYTVTVTDANGCTAVVSAPYNGCDYGDLADNNTPGSYPTDATNGAGEGVGPSHHVVPGIKLGATVDAEAGGASSANANGDDIAGSDDENGVPTFPMFVAGQTVTVSVNVMNMNPDDDAAKLTAYFDWNADGDFNDAGEMVSVSVPQGTNGNVNLSVPVPIGTSLNANLGARFRLSTDTDASMTPVGPAPDGEVEDYLIQVMAFDYGDLADNNAPGSYPTNPINGAGEGVGASHKIIAGLKIGAIVDPEASGQPSGPANGDDLATSDDEDGVTLPMLLANQSYTVPVVVMNMTGFQAKLTGFFDWNANGSLSDAGEMVSINVPNGTNGTVNLSVSVPIDAVLNTPLGARFRLSTDATASMNPSGPAPDGEVEDYQVTAVMAFDYGDLPDGNIAGDYPTDGTNGAGEGVGPSHKIVTGLRLGNIIDIDNFGVPSASASADDAPNYLGQDDEDGVILPVFVAGQTSTVALNLVNLTGLPATLYVFFDFNRDGDFADAGETFSIPVPNGTNGTINVPVSVPVWAKLNTLLGIRFRLTNDPAFSGLATGPANSGEVEDYVALVLGNDYGDLPDTYGTSGPNAPSHTVSPALTLGGCVDNEAGGLPEPMAGAMTGGDDNSVGGTTIGTCAVGSDDENGIVFETPLLPGAVACIRVTATNSTGAPAFLQAWIDFNGDGDLLDGGEALSLTGGGLIPNGGVNNQQFCFTVPAGATFQGGQAMVRFRLSSTGGLAPNNGAAANGEIEDYKVALAKIGTFVWEDSNGDGIQNEPGTNGINGASVQLVWAGPDGNLATLGDNITVATTTSLMGGYNGQYMFLGLSPGTYRVGLPVNPAGGFLPTATNQGGDDELDSDLAGGETFVIPVNFNLPLSEDGVGDVPGGTNGFPDAQDNLSFDFGYYAPASIGNYTWIDNNGNGIQDPGENPLPNVPVTLTGTTGSGVPVVQNTTTNGLGLYNFPNLAPGSYKLTFGAPAATDYVSTDVNQGGNDASDSDADPAMAGMTVFEILTSGENNTTYDAGFYIPAEIGNYTWIDENADGFQDPGEDPLPGVTVVLDGTTGTGEVVNLTAITDNNGLYTFTGLQPGSYKLTFVTPLGDYVSTLVNAPIANDANDSDADPNMGGMTVFEVLTSGESNLTYDAGYYEAASIGNFVWNDLDADGVQDSNEPGIGGVLVTLTGDDNQGNSIVLTTTTAPDGSYLFDGLVPGDYKLTFATPSGFDFPSPVNAGGNDATDSDADPSMAGMTTYETLVSGEYNPTYDAGFYECPEITFKNLPVQPVCPGEDIAGIQIFTVPGAAIISWTGGAAIGLNNGTAPGPMAEIPAFIATAEGTVTVTVTATLGQCTITNTFTITVNDVTPPVFANCPADITVGNDVDVCGANVVYSTPVGTDNCANSVSVTQTGLPSGSLFPIGTSTIVFTANDGNGNTSTCDFTITVTDEQLPDAVCKDITVALNGQGAATISVAQVDNSSSDNCPGMTLAINDNAFDCDDLGTNIVILTATDAAQNVATCMSVVTVVDEINPTMTCPASLTAVCAAGEQPVYTTLVQFTNAGGTASDNCGIESFILENETENGLTCPKTVTRTYRVSDASGNTATCVQTLTVDDNVLPTITAPSALTLTCLPNQQNNTTAVLDWLDDYTASDNCAGAITVTHDFNPSTIDYCTGADLTVTWTATDACGNVRTTAAQIVVIEDETAPVFVNCPTSITVNNDVDECGTNATWSVPVANDFCTATATVTQLNGPAQGTFIPVGISTATYIATDGCGNTASCTVTITVLDVQTPTAVCQDITIYLDANGNATIEPADVDGGSTDNCDDDLLLEIDEDDFTCNNVGDNNVTLTVTDAADNTSICVATVTVVDSINPTFTCPADVTVDGCNDLVPDVITGITDEADNCGVASITQNPVAGLDFGQVNGNTVVITVTVTDVNGNVTTCAVDVIINDDDNPDFLNCPTTMIMIGNDPDQCSGKVNWQPPVAVDDCVPLPISAPGQPAPGTVVQTTGPLPGSVVAITCPPTPTTITYIATDGAGNTSSCTFQVMVVDTEKPELDADIIMPNDTVVNCHQVPNNCVYHGPNVCTPLANSDVNDNCTSPQNLVINYTEVSTQNPNPAVCAHYDYDLTRTWTVTDCAGNQLIHVQDIEVQDTTKPVAICKNITVTLDKTGRVVITPADINNGSFDNCAAAQFLTYTISQSVFTCLHVGQNVVTLTVTDPCGNFSTCQAIVTVVEGIGMCTPAYTVASSCMDNATTLDNGQFQDIITVKALAMQTWTLTANNGGLFTNTSPAPPAAGVVIPVGAVFTAGTADGIDNDGDGAVDEADEMIYYTLRGRFTECVGYTITIGNGTNFGNAVSATNTTISNKACYPTPYFINLDGPFCLNTPPFVIEVGEYNNAAGTAGSFMVNGVNTNIFDAGALGEGFHTVMATFDAGTATQNLVINGVQVGGSIADALADPGCKQKITKVVQVTGTPTTVACNDLINISLDASCVAEVFPDMVLEGTYYCFDDYTVTLNYPAGTTQFVPPNRVDATHINKVITYTLSHIISGNMCWGTVKVEDKLEPILTCPADLTLACSESTEISHTGNVGIQDCSATTTQIDEEVIDNGECGDPRKIITRTFIVTDAWSNQSLCTQTITVVPFDLDDVVMPANITINCEVANANPSATLPNNTGRPSINGAPIGIGGLCSASLGYTDVVLDICEGSYEIYRTWFVANTCLAPGDDNPITHLQRIRVNDIGGPVFSCPADVTVSVDPFSCCATAALPDVLVSEGCSNITDLEAKVTGVDPSSGNITTFTIPGSLADFPGNNHWNPDTLAVFPFTQCLPNNNTYTVRYTAADQCGNTSSCEFSLSVLDLVPPAVSCDEFTQVSLGIDGRILVNASTFDDGTYDNCCLDGFEVARMVDGPCDQNNTADDFAPTVEFCCADLGDTITVVFRAYDCTGNTNDCMVQVYVDDKLKPVCSAPANVTVSCENFDPSLWAYGAPSATDNCCMDTITTLVILTNFDTTCNKGTITRRFTAIDCAGQTSTCTQRIVVNYEQDYFVRFPNDKILYACDSSFFEQPTVFGEDCEMLATSFHDQVFNVDPDACFKIERTWEVINWCTHNPNLPLIDVPNPNPNPNSNSPQNLMGPVVSALGSTGLWTPTVVRINPTDPTTTNYSIFWEANANGYRYKQIIKVVDNEDPVVANCPDTLVEVCDLTPNSNQFWNDMAWWDNTIGLHDLCEAPTDLNITATDSCTGASVNVRYILFLDTDNDGDMETVISSTNPPTTAGAVNVGNATNPNFTGGVTTSFDQRAVPSNQKYRFAVQQTLSGNSKVAALRWNTDQSPNTYVVPQFPYGTHKIKWIVEDGCGNEKVCEYEFVVKDCKAPTVVCINGLSANIMPTDMIVLWASDFLQYTEDNCTPTDQIKIGIRRKGAGTGFPTNPDGTPQTSVTFTCADLGTQFVELWGLDAAGNADYCETYIIVQDNAGNCSNSNVTVAGELKTEMQEGLQDAEVELNGSHPALPPINMFEQSEINGSYMFGNAMPAAANYTVTPTKDDDHLNGVSTYDLVLINKHILGIESFDSPYKIIASDANNSKSVTTFDIAEIRKLILGIYTELPNNTSWRFVDESYTFPNPDNPFAPAFPESKSVADIQNNALNDDFVSVKVGDVNNTMIANNLMSTDDRTSSTMLFDVKDRTVARGEAIDVHFKADQFAQGYQFTLNLKGLEVLDIVPGEGMNIANFAVFSEVLTTSFDAAPGLSAPAEFTLRLRAKTAGSLSNMMNISSSVTKAEAYGKDAERQSVALRFNGKEVRGVGFEVYQNQPNPWINRTIIGFYLPEATEATLNVYDETGRLLFNQTGDFAKGHNAFTLDKALVNTTGVLYYQVSTSENSATMKMIQTR